VIVLGVAGGIAAYKAVELLRRLRDAGHEVRVVPTAGALEFVGPATWEAISGLDVSATVWADAVDVPHVRLGRAAELVLVAPATADLLARAAAGRSDDLLTATLLTARCPVVFAPAMHTEMWEHPATQENVATLRRRGCLVVDPAVGRLTGADTGPGRLPEPAELAAVAAVCLGRGVPPRDLAGRHVVVSAGGTREPLDPVRWLGNRSSGRQGYAAAAAARLRGATVTLVAAYTALPDPAGVHVVPVGTAAEMGEAVTRAAADADAVVMAAAVADFRPLEPAASKIKKTGRDPEPVRLVRTVDVLAGLAAARRPGQVLVGFAAETPAGVPGSISMDDSLRALVGSGREKLARKGADLLVVNRVGAERSTGTGFDTGDNAGVILGADASVRELRRTTKDLFAHAVWDAVVPLLPGRGPEPSR